MKCRSGNSGQRSGPSRQRLESLVQCVTAITTAAVGWLVLAFTVALSPLELLVSGSVALVLTLALSLGIWAWRHF